MIAYKVKEGVYWVGAIDWNLRSFHGYSTDKGTTYNAYLIIDEMVTLIDTVHKNFSHELLSRISTIIDPSKIDIIISNHSEPDHSGSIEEILKYAINAKIYSSSPNGAKILKAIHGELPIIPVKSGESISIGKRTLKFFHAPMVHWPDNMVTYDMEDRILFSNDLFGEHYASSTIFDGDNDLSILLKEAKKYYANIVLPYTNQANKAASTLLDLDIDIIATGHGVIWRDHINSILDLYKEMITSTKKEKAVIVYDSMWGSTERMAHSIVEAFMKKNIPAFIYNINVTHESDIMAEVIDCKYLAVGSSTINNNMLPPIASFLCYLKGLAPVGINFIAFGSYGWGGQSIALIDQELEAMKLNRLVAPIKQYYAPNLEQLHEIENIIKSNL